MDAERPGATAPAPGPASTPQRRSEGLLTSPGSRIEWQDFRVANIKSQIKRNRTNEKARVRNKAAKSEVKTRIKKAVASAEVTGTETTAEDLRVAVKRLDKAAARGIIHKNQAANRKSRLVKRINALTSSASEE